jgi:hypothetical protein
MVGDEDTMAVALRHRRFTLDQYHRMGETGILHEDTGSSSSRARSSRRRRSAVTTSRP